MFIVWDLAAACGNRWMFAWTFFWHFAPPSFLHTTTTTTILQHHRHHSLVASLCKLHRIHTYLKKITLIGFTLRLGRGMASVHSVTPTPMNSAATLPLPSPSLSPLSSLGPLSDEGDDSRLLPKANLPSKKRVSKTPSVLNPIFITHTHFSLWKMERLLLEQNAQVAPKSSQARPPGALGMLLTLPGASLETPNGMS